MATQTETDGWPDGSGYQLSVAKLAKRSDHLVNGFEAYGGEGPSATRTALDKANVLYHIIVVLSAERIASLHKAFNALPLDLIHGTPLLTIEASYMDGKIVGVLDVFRPHGTTDPDNLLLLMQKVASWIKAELSA